MCIPTSAFVSASGTHTAVAPKWEEEEGEGLLFALEEVDQEVRSHISWLLVGERSAGAVGEGSALEWL